MEKNKLQVQLLDVSHEFHYNLLINSKVVQVTTLHSFGLKYRDLCSWVHTTSAFATSFSQLSPGHTNVTSPVACSLLRFRLSLLLSFFINARNSLSWRWAAHKSTYSVPNPVASCTLQVAKLPGCQVAKLPLRWLIEVSVSGIWWLPPILAQTKAEALWAHLTATDTQFVSTVVRFVQSPGHVHAFTMISMVASAQFVIATRTCHTDHNDFSPKGFIWPKYRAVHPILNQLRQLRQYD